MDMSVVKHIIECVEKPHVHTVYATCLFKNSYLLYTYIKLEIDIPFQIIGPFLC